MKIYSGYINDEKELLSTSSGGVATALSRVFISNGGCVFGARYSEDFYRVEYCCIEDYDGLELLKGSKYTKAIQANIYEVLEEKINNGKQVLFIGLGCDIGALKAFCRSKSLDTNKLYTIDILCHGTAVEGVHESYVTELEKKYNSKLTSFTIRHKKHGWTPFYIKATFVNGKKYIAPFNGSSYEKAFRMVAKPGCTKCPFKGDKHKGDICIGDYWGMDKDADGWNKNGVSIMIVQNDKGEDLLAMLGDDFSIKEENPEHVLKGNPLYQLSRTQKANYNSFITDLNNKGLNYAVKNLPKEELSLFQKVKQIIKQIIYKY